MHTASRQTLLRRRPARPRAQQLLQTRRHTLRHPPPARLALHPLRLAQIQVLAHRIAAHTVLTGHRALATTLHQHLVPSSGVWPACTLCLRGRPRSGRRGRAPAAGRVCGRAVVTWLPLAGRKRRPTPRNPTGTRTDAPPKAPEPSELRVSDPWNRSRRRCAVRRRDAHRACRRRETRSRARRRPPSGPAVRRARS